MKGFYWLFLVALFLLLFVREQRIYFWLWPDVRLTWPSHISYISGGAFISLRFCWESAPLKYATHNIPQTVEFSWTGCLRTERVEDCCLILIGFQSQPHHPSACGRETVYVLCVPRYWRRDPLTLSDVTCITISWQLWHSPPKPDHSQFRLCYSKFRPNKMYECPMDRGMWDCSGFNRLAFYTHTKFI
jgi:hypothetical protein